MGRGRAPCCDRSQVKRGPWSPSEDLRLIAFIQMHGHENWRALPKQAGLQRCGKSCRLRWVNYLRPDVKRGNFTKEEEDTIINLQQALGNKWSIIATHLPGRTDNEIKNIWNTHLKKRLAARKSQSCGGESNKDSSITCSSSSSTDSSIYVGKQNIASEAPATGEQARRANQQMTVGEDSKNQVTKHMSSNSLSSYDSNVSNSSQVGVVMPEEQMADSTVECIGPCNDVNNTLQEVNKPNPCRVSNFGTEQEVGLPFHYIEMNKQEIPLESDYDFWNMLDNIGTFLKPNNDQVQPTSILGEENRKWIQELENELGLGAIKEETQDLFLSNRATQTQPLVEPQRFQSGTLTNAETDQGMPWFQLGQPWTQKS